MHQLSAVPPLGEGSEPERSVSLKICKFGRSPDDPEREEKELRFESFEKNIVPAVVCVLAVEKGLSCFSAGPIGVTAGVIIIAAGCYHEAKILYKSANDVYESITEEDPVQDVDINDTVDNYNSFAKSMKDWTPPSPGQSMEPEPFDPDND